MPIKANGSTRKKHRMPRLAQLAFIGADAWVERFRFVKKRFGYLTSCTCLTIATGVAAIFINSRLGAKSEPDWCIGARDSNRGLDLVLCRTADGVNGVMFGARVIG